MGIWGGQSDEISTLHYAAGGPKVRHLLYADSTKSRIIGSVSSNSTEKLAKLRWMWNDPWQRFHSTTPYFMPFMLWRDGSVEPSIAYALIAAWFLVLAALISVLLLLRAKARGWGFEERSAG